MQARLRLVTLAITGFVLSACGHNFPQTNSPTLLIEPSSARVYSDMNGNFFPEGWRDTNVVGEAAFLDRDSLLAAIGDDPAKRKALFSFEQQFLDDLETLAQNHQGKAYVFLVGFNAAQASTSVQLAAMQDAIAISLQDLIVEFYWDGHHAKVGVDAARIWFYATGNSKLVGSRGLRRVLNALADRELIIVSYSRGASVVLSALSNPDYDDDFVVATEDLSYLNSFPLAPLFDPPPLMEGGPIDVVMMAPAVGASDFYEWGEDTRPVSYRPFPERLRSIRFTVNPRDEVLNKFWIIGARRFNSTELGATSSLSLRLACHYTSLYPYPVATKFGHDGMAYIRDESYRRMLRDAGASLSEPLEGPGASRAENTAC